MGANKEKRGCSLVTLFFPPVAFDENDCTWFKRRLDSTTTISPPTERDGGGAGEGELILLVCRASCHGNNPVVDGLESRPVVPGGLGEAAEGGGRERKGTWSLRSEKCLVRKKDEEQREGRKPKEGNCKTQTRASKRS